MPKFGQFRKILEKFRRNAKKNLKKKCVGKLGISLSDPLGASVPGPSVASLSYGTVRSAPFNGYKGHRLLHNAGLPDVEPPFACTQRHHIEDTTTLQCIVLSPHPVDRNSSRNSRVVDRSKGIPLRASCSIMYLLIS